MLPPTSGSTLKAVSSVPLAVVSLQRASFAPDLPTVAETYPSVQIMAWHAIAAPAGTPKAIVDKLNAELKATLATPEVVGYMSEAGIESVGSAPAEMDAYFREERDRWARIVKEVGAKID